jgi:hypothetical protein
MGRQTKFSAEVRERAVRLVRERGSSPHPPAIARSAAELNAPGISLSLRGSSLRVGRQRPTEMVLQRSVPPPLSPLRWTERGHWPPALSPSVYPSCRRTGSPPPVRNLGDSGAAPEWPEGVELCPSAGAGWRVHGPPPRSSRHLLRKSRYWRHFRRRQGPRRRSGVCRP